MNKAEKLIDINTSQLEHDQILKSLITTKMNQEFRKSFEQKLSAQNSKILQMYPDKKIIKESVTFKNHLMIWGAIAAGLLLLVISNLVFSSEQSASTLAMNYLANTEIVHPGTSRSIGGVEVNKSAAIIAFNEGNYKTAVLHFSSINSKTDEDAFYLGVSYLHIGDYNNAILHLKESMLSNLYNAESQYFLIIGLVLNNNKALALEIASEMSVGDYKYDEIHDILSAPGKK